MKVVCFDVDFTLIHPGPAFRAEGYRQFCANHGLDIDHTRFDEAVASAGALLDSDGDDVYDAELFVGYTRHIIERMGGSGEAADRAARDIYREWAICHHFELYEDVPDVLRTLASAGLRLGIISNTHRSLEAFQQHFALDGLIAAAVSSYEHGYMKPHPSIFEAALELLQVAPADAMMVGDSMRHDIEGARRAGMKAVLVERIVDPGATPGEPPAPRDGVPVIRSLRELPALILKSRPGK